MDYYGSAGVQHLALYTSNIIKTVSLSMCCKKPTALTKLNTGSCYMTACLCVVYADSASAAKVLDFVHLLFFVAILADMHK